MKKEILKKRIIILLVAFIILLLLLINFGKPLEREWDNEFKDGSGIHFTEINQMQTDNLYILCKVWGITKYYHPSITNGTINWDAELFRVMPQVLDAADIDEATTIIFEWINKFAFEIPELSPETTEVIEDLSTNVILKPDLTWIENTKELGDDLSAYLVRLSEVEVLDYSNGYASFKHENIFVDMDGEDEYKVMRYDDTAMRLLGLFRYWNIIEYFFPYKDIMEEDWDQVLKEMIPMFIGEQSDILPVTQLNQSKQSYLLSIAHLSTYIHDTHAGVYDNSGGMNQYFGRKVPPIEFENIEGQIVISEVANNEENGPSKLELGDVVLAMDGIDIADRIDNCKKFISLSNDDRFESAFRYYLLGTNNDTAIIEVLRDNKTLSLTVECYYDRIPLSGQGASGFIENDQIGYINPSKLKSGDIDKLMTQFKDTKGLIVDLRYYPSDFIVYTLAEYLIPSPTPFVKLGHCNPFVPGEFIEKSEISSGSGSNGSPKNRFLYTNKVVLLMDETSLSQAEFTIMSLRNAPNAVVLGSPSIGADGDVVVFKLPGNITTCITGLSVFYPDGTQTQRIGLAPDIYFDSTINGIKAGKDELIDEAVSIILTQ